VYVRRIKKKKTACRFVFSSFPPPPRACIFYFLFFYFFIFYFFIFYFLEQN